MDEFSFYHIVNRHSAKVKASKVRTQDPDVVMAPVETAKYHKFTTRKTKHGCKGFVQNIGYFIATIITAIALFGMMALFALVA